MPGTPTTANKPELALSETPSSKKSVYITVDRQWRHGQTPGCPGCKTTIDNPKRYSEERSARFAKCTLSRTMRMNQWRTLRKELPNQMQHQSSNLTETTSELFFAQHAVVKAHVAFFSKVRRARQAKQRGNIGNVTANCTSMRRSHTKQEARRANQRKNPTERGHSPNPQYISNRRSNWTSK